MKAGRVRDEPGVMTRAILFLYESHDRDLDLTLNVLKKSQESFKKKQFRDFTLR